MTSRLIVCLLSLLPYCTQATLLASYEANSSPSSQGWSYAGRPMGTSQAGILDGGQPAWAVAAQGYYNSASDYDAPFAYYTYTLSANRTALLQSSDWIFKTTMRITDPATHWASTIKTQFWDGSAYYDIFFGNGSVAFGNAAYQLGTDIYNYHDYEIRYNRAQDSADLWIDGQRVISGYTASKCTSCTVGPNLSWGVRGREDRVAANYAHVSLTAVPLPAAIWLFGSGLFGFGVCAIRSRQSGNSQMPC